MCGDYSAQSICNFWQHIKGLPDYKDHEVLRSLSNEELKKTIPFSLHADGCEFYSDQEFFAVSWSSALTAGGCVKDILATKFPILVVAETSMEDDSVI